MSRSHFAIAYSEDAPVIRDLGSSNGTFVNGEVIREAELQNGDRIMAGTTVFVVRFLEVNAESI